MQQVRGGPGKYAYVIGPYMEPIATVRPGELFAVETADAFENRVDSPDADITKIVELPYVNPLTGPVCRCQGKMSGISVERLCQ